MRLWKNGNGGSAGSNASALVRAAVEEQVQKINRQVISRGVRAVNAMRNAELEVLKGQRGGRVYRKPHTKSATYTASAPGEPPARRTGNLRMHWDGHVTTERASNTSVSIVAQLESQESYAGYLENGTSKMSPRPFVEKIKEKAAPEIQKIYGEPYS